MFRLQTDAEKDRNTASRCLKCRRSPLTPMHVTYSLPDCFTEVEVLNHIDAFCTRQDVEVFILSYAAPLFVLRRQFYN